MIERAMERQRGGRESEGRRGKERIFALCGHCGHSFSLHWANDAHLDEPSKSIEKALSKDEILLPLIPYTEAWLSFHHYLDTSKCIFDTNNSSIVQVIRLNCSNARGRNRFWVLK